MKLTNDKRPLVQRRERRLSALGHALCERPAASPCSRPTRTGGSSERDRITPDFAYGWNAGWSEAGGVGRVARYLEAQGTTDITIDLVCEYARAAGASRHLSRRDKVRWCKSVVALYEKERRPAATAARVVS